MPEEQEFKEIKDIEIMRAGTFMASTGRVTITDAMMKGIVDNAKELASQINVAFKITHKEQSLAVDDKGTVLPDLAIGWLANLRLEAGRILADITDVPMVVWQAIKDKRYKGLSPEFSTTMSIDEKVFENVLTGLSLLGASQPAISGLNPQGLHTLLKAAGIKTVEMSGDNTDKTVRFSLRERFEERESEDNLFDLHFSFNDEFHGLMSMHEDDVTIKEKAVAVRSLLGEYTAILNDLFELEEVKASADEGNNKSDAAGADNKLEGGNTMPSKEELEVDLTASKTKLSAAEGQNVTLQSDLDAAKTELTGKDDQIKALTAEKDATQAELTAMTDKAKESHLSGIEAFVDQKMTEGRIKKHHVKTEVFRLSQLCNEVKLEKGDNEGKTALAVEMEAMSKWPIDQLLIELGAGETGEGVPVSSADDVEALAKKAVEAAGIKPTDPGYPAAVAMEWKKIDPTGKNTTVKM